MWFRRWKSVGATVVSRGSCCRASDVGSVGSYALCSRKSSHPAMRTAKMRMRWRTRRLRHPAEAEGGTLLTEIFRRFCPWRVASEEAAAATRRLVLMVLRAGGLPKQDCNAFAAHCRDGLVDLCTLGHEAFATRTASAEGEISRSIEIPLCQESVLTTGALLAVPV